MASLWLHFAPQVRVIVANDRMMRRYIRGRIAEHRATYDPENIRDFLDLYLRTADQGEDSDIYTGEKCSLQWRHNGRDSV